VSTDKTIASQPTSHPHVIGEVHRNTKTLGTQNDQYDTRSSLLKSLLMSLWQSLIFFQPTTLI